MIDQKLCVILTTEKSETQRRPTLFGGANPPDERKEGDANELCYISGFSPDRYLHCHSRRTVLYSLREKKIAAHYPHSERLGAVKH